MKCDDEISGWSAVNARPDDPLSRLVMADWLEGQGRGYEAEALRWADKVGLLMVDERSVPARSRFTASIVPRNLKLAHLFLTPELSSYMPNHAASWQALCAAWSLCRRAAGIDPRGEWSAERFRRQRANWHNDASLVIGFALAQLPPDATDREKRRAVSAAYPFGERKYHPYKIWLSEVKRRLGPSKHRRAPEQGPRSLFEVVYA